MNDPFDADKIEISIGNVHILQKRVLATTRKDKIKKRIMQGKLQRNLRVFFGANAGFRF